MLVKDLEFKILREYTQDDNSFDCIIFYFFMNEVKNDYIEAAIKKLIPVIGIKEFVDDAKLYPLVHSRKYKECIKEIALYLGLPIEVNVSYVPSGYSSDNADGFQSKHLVKTGEDGGVAGITADVQIPQNLPFYGSAGMINFPINVRLSENCSENPASFIAVLAHELSHIVLHSIWHTEKSNEFYTDLTGMMLGFASIMKSGRIFINTTEETQRGFLSSTTTRTTRTITYGYLSDENFDFAFNFIISTLNKQKASKNKFSKKIKHFNKRVNNFKKRFIHFTKYIEYIDKNLDQKISQEDGNLISVFHQPGFIDNLLSIVKENELNLKSSIQNLKDSTVQNLEMLEQCQAKLQLDDAELAKQYFLLGNNVRLLKKYISLRYRIKQSLALWLGNSLQ